MNETIQYDDDHADIFVQDTELVDMSANYQKFIPLLPPGGLILDVGCGIFYVSLKYGDREYLRGGRYFNGYDEAALQALLAPVPELQLHEMRITLHVRPSHEGEAWLKAVLVRR